MRISRARGRRGQIYNNAQVRRQLEKLSAKLQQITGNTLLDRVRRESLSNSIENLKKKHPPE